jgi:hypothetical protein
MNTTKAILLFVFVLSAGFGFSQSADSTKQTLNFSGTISATNNGFSLIPTFSLGEPAVVTIFNLSSRGRLSFEPEFRYSMDFKPWSLVFIWRYKLIRQEKFQLALGTHLPALNFVSGKAKLGEVEQEVIRARRFFPVVEAIPTYRINDRFNVGLYYLFSIGLEDELTKDNHFLTLRSNYNNIPLSKQYYLNLNLQFYYLKLDEPDGFYAAGALVLARRGFPFSISTLMNKEIRSTIKAKQFDWNVSLNYTFGRNYVEK